MSGQSAATINEAGALYMSGMSEQTAIRFENIIGLRMDQLDVLVGAVPAEKVHTDQAVRDELIYDALARDFTYLAFYKTDGTLYVKSCGCWTNSLNEHRAPGQGRGPDAVGKRF